MSALDNQRPEFTDAETNRRELEWWQQFAELEQRFAWVQTPALQDIIRGRYIREIIRSTPKGGRILELGCGTGWLCRKLVQFGAREVWGVDFSPAQIALAKSQAEAAGLADRVHFLCVDGTGSNPTGEAFDCVVVHAFLHHLDKGEIDRVLAGIPNMLKPEGMLIVFEPIRHGGPGKPLSRWESRQRWLAELAARGRKYGLRRESDEEARWRALLSSRSVGKEPHGPSPKEMPFTPGELEGYLHSYFNIARRRECLGVSHLVAQEWLLREISHPLTTKLMLPFVARIAAWMDARLLDEAGLSAGAWIFTMFVCKALQP